MLTTIKLKKETKKELDTFREHPNESYDQVLRKVMFISGKAENEPELSQKTIQEIQEARERMSKGEFLTEEQMRKRLGL